MTRIVAATPQTMPLIEDGLRALARDLGDPYEADRDRLERALFAPAPACQGVLALSDGAEALRGIAVFSPFLSTMRGAVGIFVSDLWVAGEARGAGLGPRLLAAAARRGRTLWQASHLRLISYDDNPRAGAFYGAMGFTPHTGETTLRLDGAAFDALARTE
ncbi:GNAT family N-acetyltransferase [Aestuariicoccus sp. MJ-SS9]|uniref:GNAT family N-acetyltransferase n=1 Tax=Aestuariicoccus sp. MJ-SS9 TaxID=3079855 RepID=UPI00290E95C9|nr:GNAT family N-acetyltransferase [Aestuariicoccus sp. MJ-SS9]MDU8913682.1 GNAT family N-acetyltransferase [Aestuariicoccus sp. MJ-SS9]